MARAVRRTATPVAATDTTTCTGTPDSPAALIAAILTAVSKPNMASKATLAAMPDLASLAVSVVCSATCSSCIDAATTAQPWLRANCPQ